jgi:putative hydrolase of the HAD superfamily
MNNIPPILNDKNTIIFDLFHTLTSFDQSGRPWTADILGIKHEQWTNQLVEKSPDRLLGKIRDPFKIIENLVHSIDPNIPDNIIEKAFENRLMGMREALLNISRENITALKNLKNTCKKIGLISNADYLEIDSWSDSPLAPLFDSTIFSCQVGFVKPQKEIYELCLKELGVSADDAIFVGDGGSNELVGARGIGMKTIMMTGVIKNFWPHLIEERKDQADYIIEKISDLI